MRKLGFLVSGVVLSAACNTALAANTEGNVYLGFGLSSLALDSERVVGVPTRSPSHTSKIGMLFLGYQFNDLWSADTVSYTHLTLPTITE